MFNLSFFLKFNKSVDIEDIEVVLENGETVEEIEEITKKLYKVTLDKEGDFIVFLKYKGEIVDVKRVNSFFDKLYHHAFGNWEIKNNKMYFYDLDGNILAVYELYDKRGNPTDKAIFKRIKVE